MLSVGVTGQILIHGPLDLSGRGQAEVRDFLKTDVTFGNLEATVEAMGAWPTKTKTLHLASPAALSSLRSLGFHAVTHANNHAFDLGPPGILATRSAANAAGLRLAGSGANIDEAAAPVVVGDPDRSLAVFSVDLGPQPDINYASADRAGIAPLRVRRSVTMPLADFAVLARIVTALGDDAREAARASVGYRSGLCEGVEVFGTPVTAGDEIKAVWAADEGDMQRLIAGMAIAKSNGCCIAVAIHGHHWDAAWSQTPPWLLDLFRGLIDEGADLILGTGAPVMQPIHFHRGRAIIPGLGNFVFHTRRAESYRQRGVDVWRSAAIRLELSANGECQRLEILPVAVGRPADDGLARAPEPLEGAEAQEIANIAYREISPADYHRIKPLKA